MSFPTILRSVDVSQWAETVQIRGISLAPNGVQVSTDAPLPWRNVTPPGWDGGIQYTLWPVVSIAGQEYTCACIEFWEGLDRNGGPVCEPGQLAKNWYYFAGPPLATFNPAPGNPVGWFITSGDQRQKDVHAVQERSNIVYTPFAYGNYHFQTAPAGPLAPPADSTAGAVDPVLSAIQALDAKVDAYQAENRAAFKQVAVLAKKAFPWISQ